MTITNSKKLADELLLAGIPFVSCDSDGNVGFKPEATQAKRNAAETIVAAHDPVDYDLIKQQSAVAELKAI